MSLEQAFAETLNPLIERVEAAAEGLARKAELVGRADLTGVPTDRAAFTVKEVSKLLSVTTDTVRQQFHAGELEGRQFGNRILIWRWSVLEFMGLSSPDAVMKKARR